MFSKKTPLEEKRLHSLMELAGELAFRLSLQGEIIQASKRAASMLAPGTPLAGMSLFELVRLSDRHAIEAAFMQAVQTRQITRVSVRLSTRAGAVWFELEMVAVDEPDAEVLVAGRDVSAQHATEERLRHMATHDELTGLPNRSLLTDRLRMAIAQARRSDSGFTVVELDLDGFKKVNDALGHGVGDSLLRIAADRLRVLLRDVDTLARVGGDEFVVVLPGVIEEAEINAIARRMISSMQLPFEIDGNTLYVSTSIGAAVYPVHGDTDVKLLAHADTALYRAKETGKARCVIYNQIVFNRLEHDVSMEAAMFEAVRNGEFLLHYQPIVDARTRQIMGFEALMRWMRPDMGMVPPNQFIPMAEDNGLINLLGAWALKVACVQVKRFQEAAGRTLYVSVNVSPRQFRSDQFIDMVDDALKLSGLDGSQLLLEITEGILMSDPEHAEQLLTKITSRGVRIAIDDFGTGYSSLVYLKRFPIAALKIDRTFIKDLPESVKDAAICNVVLSLASHLGLSTVAEGVENEFQLKFLAMQGCSLIQGFHTGHPMVPNAVIDVLQSEAALQN
ncbi:EAL domain-containing protein [uncultured Oxalicibacterium sp.]|uniref:putative bifunctional diguanylate cyclase/phosphodiesterase n=1 Tax=uncultured Oxalicibacterium sp. TaxID=1168540 RepID=UPI0025DB89C6|nr:EAL domain-containing protein [uncultured Oxalicibacterium sp.]